MSVELKYASITTLQYIVMLKDKTAEWCSKKSKSKLKSKSKSWGSEFFSGKNMGARNRFLEKYGGAKYFFRKIWGHETFFWKNMEV